MTLGSDVIEFMPADWLPFAREFGRFIHKAFIIFSKVVSLNSLQYFNSFWPNFAKWTKFCLSYFHQKLKFSVNFFHRKMKNIIFSFCLVSFYGSRQVIDYYCSRMPLNSYIILIHSWQELYTLFRIQMVWLRLQPC